MLRKKADSNKYYFRINIISRQEEKSEEESDVFSLCKCIKQGSGLRINKPRARAAPGLLQPPGHRDVTSLKLIPGSARSQRHGPGCLIKRSMKKWKNVLLWFWSGEKLTGVLSKSSRKRKFSSGQSRKRKKSSQPRIEGDNHDIVYHDIFLQQILSVV